MMMSSHFITLLGHPNGRRFDPDLIEIGSFERFKLKLSLELFLICQVARQNPRQDRQRSSSFQNSIFTLVPEETNSTSHQSFIFNLSYFHRRPVEPAFSMNGTFLPLPERRTNNEETYIYFARTAQTVPLYLPK